MGAGVQVEGKDLYWRRLEYTLVSCLEMEVVLDVDTRVVFDGLAIRRRVGRQKFWKPKSKARVEHFTKAPRCHLSY